MAKKKLSRLEKERLIDRIKKSPLTEAEKLRRIKLIRDNDVEMPK